MVVVVEIGFYLIATFNITPLQPLCTMLRVTNSIRYQAHVAIVIPLAHALVEAFSAGIPFISTKVGGTAEIIDSKKGILIPPKDEDALVKAMHKAVKTNWDKNAIRDYAIQTFGIDKIGEELNCIYNQILGN